MLSATKLIFRYASNLEPIHLTISALKTHMTTFENSVDPDETARLIWIHTVCHSFIDY